MAGKIKKGVLFAVGGMALVLFATFIYINNDLGPSAIRQTIEREVISKLPVLPGTAYDEGKINLGEVKLENSDVAKPESDADLDAVFNADEPADNFDDLVE